MGEAAEEPGAYFSPFWGKKYPRIQLYTVSELLEGTKANLPQTCRTYQQAAKITAPAAEKQPNSFGSDGWTRLGHRRPTIN